MNFGLISNSYSSITNGNAALQQAQENDKTKKMNAVAEYLQRKNETFSTIPSEMIVEDGKINGEYTSGFSGTFTNQADKNAHVIGAAANQGNDHVQGKTIDKTSVLYEKCMELESYFVKQMLSSMRNTVLKAEKNDFAQDMYEDMLYDEYATSMTKNAGFGLADQIYLSLS